MVARLREKLGPVLALAALNLLFALLAAAPLSAALAPLLDDRPAAEAIADSPDDAPRAELLEDHPELGAIAVEAALVAMVLWAALSWIACGGLLAEGEPFVLASARHARRMLAVGLAGLPLRLPVLLGPLVAWPLVANAHQFRGLALGVAVGALVAGALWSLGTVTLDRARGVVLAQPELSVWRALRGGFAASRARFGNTVTLAAFSGLGFVGVTALQLLCTRALPSGATGLCLAAGAFGAVGRAAFTTATLLAANAKTAG